ncbi:MFS domain-containing protein [Meloidogyne graminicola]|uniref:MFS domain-containing protein n=1 Tax=Meloidogyne graminicola TaxID=189291 RepID=A0A8S9ZZG7_9BILA|nr:MFS domain-containing protein [Meloidogyne graminicola]
MFNYYFLKIRYLILILSTICMIILLNFTIICMNKEEIININKIVNYNQTLPKFQQNKEEITNKFSAIQRSHLVQLLGEFLINPLINKFNIRYTITGFCLISALSTLIFPFCEKFLGFLVLCFLRILQGTCFPAEYVIISIVSRKWAPINSISTFLVLSSTHFQIGPLFTMPIAGYFCVSNFGWEGIYYLMSILTIILTILFYLFFRDCPSEHPWISENELKQIEFENIPYYEIITDWSIWLLIMAFISDEIAFQLFTEMGPYYLNKYGICISMAGLAFFPNITSSFWIILPFYAFLNVFTGLDFLGIFRYSQYISVKYSELIISWLNIVMSIISLTLPGIVALIAPNDTIKQWTFIFLIISLIVFISITIFILFATSSPRKWALETNNNTIINNTDVVEKKIEEKF